MSPLRDETPRAELDTGNVAADDESCRSLVRPCRCDLAVHQRHDSETTAVFPAAELTKAHEAPVTNHSPRFSPQAGCRTQREGARSVFVRMRWLHFPDPVSRLPLCAQYPLDGFRDISRRFRAASLHSRFSALTVGSNFPRQCPETNLPSSRRPPRCQTTIAVADSSIRFLSQETMPTSACRGRLGRGICARHDSTGRHTVQLRHLESETRNRRMDENSSTRRSHRPILFHPISMPV